MVKDIIDIKVTGKHVDVSYDTNYILEEDREMIHSYILQKIFYCMGYIDSKYGFEDGYNQYTAIECMNDFEDKYVSEYTDDEKKRMNIYNSSIKNAHEKIQSLKHLNKKIVKELETINKENNELESKLKSHEYKIKDAESKLKYKDKCIEDLNREIRKKEAEIRRLHRIITQSRE